MEKYIYLDNSATTIPCKASIDAASDSFKVFGNPSSPHTIGINAKKAVNKAREIVAKSFGCESDEVYFTSSGTEANNTAIFGAAKLKSRFSKTIVATDSEHPSVENSLKVLEESGYKVIRIKTVGGILNEEDMKSALAEPVALVTVMQANNETGAVYDLKAVKRIITESGCGALFHSDCVQSYLKSETNAASICDMVSVSAHKVNALKGCGALYVKKSVKLPPYIIGGGQEHGLRSGTENTHAICAFGASVSEWLDSPERVGYIKGLKSFLISKLNEALGDNVKCNLSENGICSVLSVTVKGMKSEVLLNFLSLHDIYISASSACSSKKTDNRVLSAFGLRKNDIECTVRIGLSYMNTESDLERLCETISVAYNKLVHK